MVIYLSVYIFLVAAWDVTLTSTSVNRHTPLGMQM